MKQLIFSMITLVAASAWAQAPATEAAKEAQKPAERQPTAEGAKLKQAAATPRKPRRWHEDARHCLERPTNIEVIKCAEEYL